jgi:predicted dinucleotide-binding enzyme
MRIGVIGSGEVGQTLSDGFLKHGHEVMRGSRDPAKLAGWKGGAGPKAHTGTMPEAARFGEVVVLAVKGTAAVAAAEACAEGLAGKTVIDTCNPIAEAPPANGVLPFFTRLDASLMEDLQRRVPQARFVKAFSCVGSALMVDPKLPGGKPTMFVCGNDDAAKRQVSGLLHELGWESEDMGKAESARAIEPLCMLWCIPGFLRNDWVHAFKVLRP